MAVSGIEKAKRYQRIGFAIAVVAAVVVAAGLLAGMLSDCRPFDCSAWVLSQGEERQ